MCNAGDFSVNQKQQQPNQLSESDMAGRRDIKLGGDDGSGAPLSFGGGGGGQSQLDFKNHCLLCLQIPRLGNPKNLKGFQLQPLLNYLIGRDPTGDLGQMPKVSPTCDLCYDILVELYRLHEKLLGIQGRIQKQTDLVREVVVKASSGGRQEGQQVPASSTSRRAQFYARMRSAVASGGGGRGKSLSESKAVEETIEFVDKLHDLIIAEAKATKKVKCPATLPPPSPTCPSVKVEGTEPRFENENTVREAPLGKMEADSDDDTFEDLDTGGIPSPGNDMETEAMVTSIPVTRSQNQKKGSSEVPCPSKRSKGPKTNPEPRAITKWSVVRSPIVTESGTSQYCDLCFELVRSPDMVAHLEGHHVQDYMTPCPNPSCPFVFSCRGKLLMHLTVTTRTTKCRALATSANPSVGNLKLIKCEVCHVEMSTSSFATHLRNHEYLVADKSLTCPIPGCLQKYGLRQSVEEHIGTHDLRQASEQDCPECKASFKLDLISDHFREAHKAEQAIPCRQCPFLFPNWERMLDHLYDHRPWAGGLSCDLCEEEVGFKFLRYESLRKHYFTQHKVGKQFLCEHCDKGFFALATLAFHKEKVHSPKPEGHPPSRAQTKSKTYQYRCDQCPGVSYTTSSSLQSHKVKEHGEARQTCRFCTKTFSSIIGVKNHERREHLGLGTTYECKVEGCGKVFKQEISLRGHQSVHNPDLKEICETCGKSCNDKAALKLHVDQEHLGKKPPRQTCDVCGETFSSNKSLKIHNLIHNSERPHSCEICGQAFRHKDVLRTHVKGHEEKGDSFKPNGPMKTIRKRVARNE